MLFIILLCMSWTFISAQSIIDFSVPQLMFYKSILSDCGLYKEMFNLNYYKIVNTQYQPDLSKTRLNVYKGLSRIPYAMNNASGMLQDAGFSLGRPTVVVLHGYDNLNGLDGVTTRTLTNAFLARGGINVLAMDYAKLLEGLYIKAVTYAKFVGDELGRTLVMLKANGVNQIHLVGHSLGAHVGSFAARYYYKILGSKIDRITGMSVAGPCFDNEGSDWKLTKSDAEFVDIIHSDYSILGVSSPIGHVDFFPNDPFALQPGCSPMERYCSHSRSFEFFAESVLRPTNFPAVACPNWLAFCAGICSSNPIDYMGYGVSRSARSLYVLRTNAASPYGMGSSGLTPRWTPMRVLASMG